MNFTPHFPRQNSAQVLICWAASNLDSSLHLDVSKHVNLKAVQGVAGAQEMEGGKWEREDRGPYGQILSSMEPFPIP